MYSAFAALSKYAGRADSLIFFNSSRFTKWGLLPRIPVTLARTAEDKLILARLGLASSYLWMNDSSVRRSGISNEELDSKVSRPSGQIRDMFCPLGVANHPDHVAVRDVALKIWQAELKRPQLYFYEDLPYAARIKNVDQEIERCIKTISGSCRKLSIRYWPLSKQLFKRKLFFSRLYLTQNDHTKVLEQHARELGSMSGFAYAERYVYAE